MIMQGFLIRPKSVIGSIGGWRTFSGEDRDFWARAGEAGVLAFIPFETRSYTQPHGSGALLKRARHNFVMVRDLYRMGASPRKLSWKIMPIIIPAYIASRFMQQYESPVTNFKISELIPTKYNYDDPNPKTGSSS